MPSESRKASTLNITLFRIKVISFTLGREHIFLRITGEILHRIGLFMISWDSLVWAAGLILLDKSFALLLRIFLQLPPSSPPNIRRLIPPSPQRPFPQRPQMESVDRFGEEPNAVVIILVSHFLSGVTLPLEIVVTLRLARIKEPLGTVPMLLIFPAGVVHSMMEESATVLVGGSGVMKPMDGVETPLAIEMLNLVTHITVQLPSFPLQTWSCGTTSSPVVQ
mmetsp:Transcript_45020/g.108887  ORF Transcript_45020/g.108887 Transcript_45020/m.108887 type:complete len:222 (+) Transcript_45020:174-839(+)